MATDDEIPSAETSGAFGALLRDVARSESLEPPPSRDPLLGSTLGHYRILAVLGRGGMGVVYRAEDLRLARSVAIKVLPASVAGDERRRRRFLREARAAAAINHPYIATIYEIGELDGRLFLAMECVEGSTLRARLAKGPIDQAEALRIARQIALGLGRAHDTAIVHRDLKPENVMLTREGDVKILDFGLAKLRERVSSDAAPTPAETLTQEGLVMGTPGYMSPEQATGKAVDQRTDVYALGVVLHEMLVGELPGALGSGKVVADVRVAQLLARCLAQTNRFASMAELLASLDEVASGSSAAPTAPKWRPSGRMLLRLSAVTATVVAAIVVARAYGVAFRRAAPPPVSADAEQSTRGAPITGRPNAGSPEAAPLALRGFTERRALLNGEDVFSISLSPDARTVAYMVRSTEGVVAYTQPVGSGSRASVPSPPGTPATEWVTIGGFFPDGGLLMGAAEPGDALALWKIGPASGAFQLVATHVHAIEDFLLLSPDGTHVAIEREDGLYTQPLAGEGAVRIGERGMMFSSVEWAPTSDWIAYGTMDPARVGSIELASSDGKRTQHLISDASLVNAVGEIAFAWPEPSHLVAMLVRGEGSALVELPVDGPTSGGAHRDLHVWADTQVGEIAVARGVVAFTRMTVDNEIFTGTLTSDWSRLSAPLTQLTSDEAGDTPGGWLEDERLVFESSREGSRALFAQAATGGRAEIIARDVRAARVMETGDVLAWRESREDAAAGCALVRIDGFEERALFTVASDDPAFVACRADLRCVQSAAGRRCVALETKNARSYWSPVDLETGRKGPLLYTTSRYLRSWALSPAGDTLAFTTQPHDPFISYVALPTGTLRQVRVTPAIEDVQFVEYSHDGRHLLLSGIGGPNGAHFLLATADPEGHAQVIATTKQAWFNSPLVSRNGRHVAVAECVFSRRLWLLEER